jgi:hypothetical protein
VAEFSPLFIDISDGILQLIQSQSNETNRFASMFFYGNWLDVIGFDADQQSP